MDYLDGFFGFILGSWLMQISWVFKLKIEISNENTQNDNYFLINPSNDIVTFFFEYNYVIRDNASQREK